MSHLLLSRMFLANSFQKYACLFWWSLRCWKSWICHRIKNNSHFFYDSNLNIWTTERWTLSIEHLRSRGWNRTFFYLYLLTHSYDLLFVHWKWQHLRCSTLNSTNNFFFWFIFFFFLIRDKNDTWKEHQMKNNISYSHGARKNSFRINTGYEIGSFCIQIVLIEMLFTEQMCTYSIWIKNEKYILNM